MDAGLSVVEIDPNFEPQIRARSNTWPCRPVEDFGEGQQASPSSDDPGISDHTKDALGIKQKTSSRRNAWGNLSYADLITKAIQSSPEQRLTLSQIYDWMVQNVPYFKDKGDNTSSAGWKNSIRHNLSLHSRFMRIQNEGTGKSSWWVINPDAKPGKAPRRRAGSMETKSLEKKRGRIKKRIEAIRAAQENGTLNSEDFPEYHYNSSLSPEFRGRAGSNASSCGRLSPIQAAVEPDLHDSQVPPMSPIPWASELEADDFVNTNSSESFSLVDSLVGGLNLKESGNLAGDQNDIEMNTLKQQLMSGGSMIRYNTGNSFEEGGGFGSMPAPPSYTDHLQQQQNSQRTVLNLDSMPVQNRNYTNLSSKQPMDVYPDNAMTSPPMLSSQNMASPGSNSLRISVSPQMNSPARSPQLSPSNYPRGSYSPQTMKRSPQPGLMSPPGPVSQSPQPPVQQGGQPGMGGGRSLLQQCLEAPTDSMLRQALTQQMTPAYPAGGQPGQLPPTAAQMQQYMQYNPGYSQPGQPAPGLNTINNNITMLPQSTMTNCAPTQQNMQQQVPQMGPPVNSNSSLAEIDTDSMLDLDYDVEQLLRQELAINPSLEFNFDGGNSSTQNGSTSDNQNLVR